MMVFKGGESQLPINNDTYKEGIKNFLIELWPIVVDTSNRKR